MSRRKEEGQRRLPKSYLYSKKSRGRGLTALLVMVVGFSLTISGGLMTAASAAAGDTIVPVPASPTTVDDPCGPDNATWNSIPAGADTEEFDFHFGGVYDDHLMVDIIASNEAFADGPNVSNDGHTYDYGTAPDSGEACPPEPTVLDIPAQPSVNDPCGPGNASWNVPGNTETLNWAVDGNGHLVVTIVAANTIFTDGSTSHDYGVAPDSGVTCAVIAPTGTIKVKCNLRVVFTNNNSASNRAVWFTDTWKYGSRKVVKRVLVGPGAIVKVTMRKVHRRATATIVANGKLLARVAHVRRRAC